jgi:hypothetical protein
MEAKEKAAQAAIPETQYKDNHFSITYHVLEIFKTGQRVTALGLNRAVGFNDARKAISLLREQGYPIRDFRHDDRRKVYFLPHDWEKIMSDTKPGVQQLELFEL